jgi:ADP-dependent NAD(P)H-hydrate dehydratase / NAD(P)H-hydrate epimerase
MVVLSPGRMAKYDEYAIRKWGIPAAVLMENAGRSTYRLMKEQYLGPTGRIGLFCGRGNNGGDGFVIARYALRDGFETRVFLLSKISDLKGDAALNMNLYTSLGGEVVECTDTVEGAEQWVGSADLLVDAIFGTGLSKAVEGKERLAIDLMNRSGKRIVAVDIPSGVDGKTGELLGTAVKAVHTYAYAYPKLGQVLYPGAYQTGQLTVIDISIPGDAEREIGTDGFVIDGPMVRGFLKERLPWSHKATFGHAAVIAGSTGKTGAAHMTSMAALKIGAGLVTLIIPESLNGIMEVKTTEVMTYPVEDKGRGHFALSSLGKILEFVSDKDVLVMGPGLSREPEAEELARRVFVEADKPFVIDADGINAFEGHLDVLKTAGRKAVLTPHPGELARLTGLTARDVNQDRIGVGKRFVEETGVNLLLKGARSILFTARGEIFICPTGNPALAKGGSGDILTGFIGGLVAQGHSLEEAALVGTYLHGYAADKWVEINTDMDLLASDLLSGLAGAIREIRDGTDRIYIGKSL